MYYEYSNDKFFLVRVEHYKTIIASNKVEVNKAEIKIRL